MKQKFHRKNCKFMKLDENHATHYSSIVQSFTFELNVFSSCKKSLWVHHGDHSPGKTRWTKFREKMFYETPRTTFYKLFMVCTNFVVLSGFHSGSGIVWSLHNASDLLTFILAVIHILGSAWTAYPTAKDLKRFTYTYIFSCCGQNFGIDSKSSVVWKVSD